MLVTANRPVDDIEKVKALMLTSTNDFDITFCNYQLCNWWKTPRGCVWVSAVRQEPAKTVHRATESRRFGKNRVIEKCRRWKKWSLGKTSINAGRQVLTELLQMI
jgi:hypothetical protein